MAKVPEIPATTRAYTVKLSCDDKTRALLWQTHVTVNRGAYVWGDWLLTLRGGLPPTLAEDGSILPVTDAEVKKELKRRNLDSDAEAVLHATLEDERRQNLKVVLALSWLSVECPASLAPQPHIVAWGHEARDVRSRKVMERFSAILQRIGIHDAREWIDACQPALTARIREDAVWVDRSGCFVQLQQQFPGLETHWATETLLDLLRGVSPYFKMPARESSVRWKPKPFVEKACNWLSAIWGHGNEADANQIACMLARIADCLDQCPAGEFGETIVARVCESLQIDVAANSTIHERMRAIAKAVGWKGNPSSDRRAVESLGSMSEVSSERLGEIIAKCREAAIAKQNELSRFGNREARRLACPWLAPLEAHFGNLIGMPFRGPPDYRDEYAVCLDHALRHVSAAHTWIKRAEVKRR